MDARARAHAESRTLAPSLAQFAPAAARASRSSARRASVAGAIERLTGLDVVEVNVEIHDVHIADDEDDHAEPRVA